MKEFQEANYARVRRRGPRRSSSDIARAKIQGKRHRVSHHCGARCCKLGLFPSLPRRAAPFPWEKKSVRPELWFHMDHIAPDSEILIFLSLLI